MWGEEKYFCLILAYVIAMADDPEVPRKPKYLSGIDAALDVVGGKWKALILYQLEGGTLRYTQILRGLEQFRLTQRMLTKELRELEASGLILRTVFPEVPSRVEYSLTEKGASIMPVLDELCLWGCRHMPEDLNHVCEECENK